MARNRNTAKQAGEKFNRSIADYLAERVDDRIDKRPRTGAKDRGDITGWRFAGKRIVAELKDYGGQIQAMKWTNEAHLERDNDDADVGLVIAKRKGVTNPGDQWVLMTVSELLSLLYEREGEE